MEGLMRKLILLVAVTLLAACGPKDQEDCKAKAAKDAKSVAAMEVLLEDCQRQFPAIKRDDGSYAYYDETLSEWVGVSGPVLSDADVEKLRELRAKKQAFQAKQDTENAKSQAKLAADRALVLSQTTIISYDISCNVDTTYIECYDKNISVKIKNNSDKTVYGVKIAYEIGDDIDCSGSLGKNFDNDISIPPGSVGSIVKNVKFDAAGPAGVMNGCVQVSSIGAISGQPVPYDMLPENLRN
jgi:hypothetical protein